MIEIKTLHLVQLFSLIQLLIAFVILHRTRKPPKRLLLLQVSVPLSQGQATRLKTAADSIVGECGFVALVIDKNVTAQFITSASKMEVQRFQPFGRTGP
jgi:uncharacterized membrane protein